MTLREIAETLHPMCPIQNEAAVDHLIGHGVIVEVDGCLHPAHPMMLAKALASLTDEDAIAVRNFVRYACS